MRNVLFVCTGNSARSVLAEALLNDLGAGRYQAFSAGSQPTGRINAGAVKKLTAAGHSTEGLASKSWDAFSGSGAPAVDIVITVCDNAAGEACPVWNGSPVHAHWGIPDPAYFDDEAARDAAFDLAYTRLRWRIEKMLALPAGLASDELAAALQRVHDESLAADVIGA